MLDLETMGNGPTAAIVAIGACEFDPHGADPGMGFPDVPVTSTFYQRVDLESSVQAGLTMDVSTVLWWMQQSDDARQQTFQRGGAGLYDAINQFAGFVNNVSGCNREGVAVWGNGATFDNVIIRSAFKACDTEAPWSFRNDRCYRTVVNLLPEDRRPAFERSGTSHNALDDAVTQARHLQKVYWALGL
ncbi:MAG: 3'-5' exonuclease [Candidatus Nanopelagicales bacterium]|nr:3'-5' exonuclease [Candidatus Nanopelagicales bacterium]